MTQLSPGSIKRISIPLGLWRNATPLFCVNGVINMAWFELILAGILEVFLVYNDEME